MLFSREKLLALPKQLQCTIPSPCFKCIDVSCKCILLILGSALPVTAYDNNGLRILLHFAKECPHGRPDVLVVVVSMLNTAPLPIKNIVLQAAVPKVGAPK